MVAVPANATDVSGDITTSTTWSVAGSPYVLVGGVTVRNGATLTVEPGVEVSLGTRTLQVGYSSQSTYCGYLVADGVTFTATTGCLWLQNGYGTMTLTDCVLEGSTGSYGVYVNAGTATLDGCTLAGDGGSYAVFGYGGGATVTDCDLLGFTYPFYITSADLILAGNDVGGCTYQAVAASGECVSNRTWRVDWGLPVWLIGGVTVRNGATLTVEPGVEVSLGTRTLQVGYSSQSTYCGYLVADGVTFTATTGCLWLQNGYGTMTLTDCVLEGSTGSYGVYVNAGTATLDGCTLAGDGGSYAVFGYGGGATVTDCDLLGFTYPFYITSADLILAGNDVGGCTYQAVAASGECVSNRTWRVDWGLPVWLIGGVTVRNGATLTVEPGVEVSLGTRTLQVGYSSQSTYCGYLVADGVTFTATTGCLWLQNGYGTMTLTDCVLEGSTGSYGVYVNAGTATLDGCTLAGDGGSYAVFGYGGGATVTDCDLLGFTYPFYITSADLILAGNDVGGCTYQAVAASGECVSNRTWRVDWGLPVWLIGGVTVRNGATLTVEPGVEVSLGTRTLQVGYSSQSTYCGYLVADGVTFTATTGCLWLQNGYGTMTLTDCVLEGSTGSYGVYVNAGTATLDGCTVSGWQTGLRVTGSSVNVVANECSFVGQTAYGVNNTGTSTVDARWCWWGHASGPSGDGPGQGTAVSQNVLYNPWLTEPPHRFVDLALSPGDVALIPQGESAEGIITVRNQGSESAHTVNVRLYRHVASSGFVLSGTGAIPYIQGGSEETTVISFTPDFIGQQIKVVASLADPAGDMNPANNQVIVVWTGEGPEPVVLKVEAENDGDDRPEVAGRYIADVEFNNSFYATVQAGAAPVSSVSFQMDSDTPVAAVEQPDGRWKATFNMGDLASGVPHTLTVVATAYGYDSEPKYLTLDVISLPSWAETWNSSFAGNRHHYKLGGFIPIEWRLDHPMPDDWLIIGGEVNRFRAGFYITAEVGLDRQIHKTNAAPALYVYVLGHTAVDFEVDNYRVPQDLVKLLDTLGYPYADWITVYNAIDIVPSFDNDTLELYLPAVNFQKSFTKKIATIPLTAGPLPIPVPWPTSYYVDLKFAPGVVLCITATASGEGVEFVQPTYVEPNLNVKLSGTINVIELIAVAVGASIQPNLNFAYNVAWVPPDFDAGWIIRFILDICLRVRFGFGPFAQDFDLGCVNLFNYTLVETLLGGEREGWLDPPVDPQGVLNRPVIIGGLGRGERVLVYAANDPGGNPAEIAAQIDLGTGSWGPQVFLTDDLYPDLDPTLGYTNAGEAVAVWTKVKTLAGDVPTKTFDELASTFDLYWSIWDGASWSAPAGLTDDAVIDGLAKVAFSNIASDGLVLWVRDEANNMQDTAGDEIAYAVWDGSAWSAPAMLTNDALGDRQVAVCYRRGSGNAVAVWTKETDPVDHLLTAYYAEWDGSEWTTPAAVSAVAELVTQVNASALSDGRVLASWAVQASGGWQVKTAVFDPAAGWSDVEIVQSQVALVDGLQAHVAADDEVHLFWHGYAEDDDLFGVSKDFGSRNGAWVGPTKLTSGAEIEWQATGVVEAGSELSLVYAREQGRSREPLPKNRNGLPDELGSAAVPVDGNWTVTDGDLTLVGDPWLGETVTVQAVVANTGTTDSVETAAQFWLGDPNDPESTPIGDAIELLPLPPMGTTVLESAEVTLTEVGHLDVYVVIAAPMAETDPTDNQAVIGFEVTYNDPIPPQVLQTVMTPLRDSGRLGARLVVSFSEPVVPPTVADMLLMGAASGQAVPDQVILDPDNTVMTVVFEDNLSHDTYTFTLVAYRIADLAGNKLDGNGDGTGGDNYVLSFSLASGDLDDDGDIDADDFAVLAGCLAGPELEYPPDCDAADLDSDTDVDLADFAEFQVLFGGQ